MEKWPASVPTSATKLKRWAARRGRQFMLASAAVAAGITLVLASVLLQRSLCLLGLPDVADPFDVAAFESERVPDDRNAFAYYRRAMERRGPRPQLPRASLDAIPSLRWPQVDPSLRMWAESNGEALAIFRDAAGLTQSGDRLKDGESTFNHERIYLEPLVQLALLDAARLEDAGDRASAWRDYRAILAMHAHLMRRGSAVERLTGNQDCRAVPARILAWASDPGTTPDLLRIALQEAIALAPRPEWEASSFKVEYRLAMRELDRTDGALNRGDELDSRFRVFGEALPPNLIELAHSVHRFVIREPERTRRILRLTFANWLAHVETPGRRGRKPVVRVRLETHPQEPGLFLYAVEPDTEESLGPKALAEWMVTAPDLRLLAQGWNWGALGHEERRQHREILIALAGELYRQEHGRPPDKEEDLIGAYLESLPDDFSELDDLAATIEEVSRVDAPAP